MGKQLLDLGGRLDPRTFGHPNVHEDDVGHRLLRLLDRLLSIGRLADELQVGFIAENHLETPAEQCVIVDHHHPEPFVSAVILGHAHSSCSADGSASGWVSADSRPRFRLHGRFLP